MLMMRLGKWLMVAALTLSSYTTLDKFTNNSTEVFAKEKRVTMNHKFYESTFTYVRDSENKLHYLYIDDRGIMVDYGNKDNIVVQLEHNKKIRIKHGKVYSNGKLYTGKMNTKKIKTSKSLKKFDYMGYENQYYWNNFVVKKGKIIGGMMYFTCPPFDPSTFG